MTMLCVPAVSIARDPDGFTGILPFSVRIDCVHNNVFANPFSIPGLHYLHYNDSITSLKRIVNLLTDMLNDDTYRLSISDSVCQFKNTAVSVLALLLTNNHGEILLKSLINSIK